MSYWPHVQCFVGRNCLIFGIFALHIIHASISVSNVSAQESGLGTFKSYAAKQANDIFPCPSLYFTTAQRQPTHTSCQQAFLYTSLGALLLWKMERFSLNPGPSKVTFWYKDLYTVRLEVYFCFFILICITTFIITNTVPREPGLWVEVKVAGGWLLTRNLWSVPVRSTVPQRPRYTWLQVCFLILKKFQISNCVPGQGGIAEGPPKRGREETWGRVSR